MSLGLQTLTRLDLVSVTLVQSREPLPTIFPHLVTLRLADIRTVVEGNNVPGDIRRLEIGGSDSHVRNLSVDSYSTQTISSLHDQIVHLSASFGSDALAYFTLLNTLEIDAQTTLSTLFSHLQSTPRHLRLGFSPRAVASSGQWTPHRALADLAALLTDYPAPASRALGVISVPFSRATLAREEPTALDQLCQLVVHRAVELRCKCSYPFHFSRRSMLTAMTGSLV